MPDDGYFILESRWTGWRERFAWFPKQLEIRRYLNDRNIGYWTTDTRWVWLKTYYERAQPNGLVGSGVPPVIYDHETDLFGVLRKS